MYFNFLWSQVTALDFAFSVVRFTRFIFSGYWIKIMQFYHLFFPSFILYADKWRGRMVEIVQYVDDR